MRIKLDKSQMMDVASAYKDKYVDDADMYRANRESLCTSSVDSFTTMGTFEEIADLVSFSDVIQKELPIGNGEDNFPIKMWSINSDRSVPKQKIVIIGGVHGNEKSSVHGIVSVMSDMMNHPDQFTNILGEYEVVFIPILNTWGYNHNERNNKNGVDLNRDFGKCTQKETKALTEYLLKHKDEIDIVLDSHNAYNETYLTCKSDKPYFGIYNDVCLRLNIFLNNAKFKSSDTNTFIFTMESQNDGTLSDFINDNGFIGHTVEAPRSITKEVKFPNPKNYVDGGVVTKELLINLMQIYIKVANGINREA